jgi:hypothetical protein
MLLMLLHKSLWDAIMVRALKIQEPTTTTTTTTTTTEKRPQEEKSV